MTSLRHNIIKHKFYFGSVLILFVRFAPDVRNRVFKYLDTFQMFKPDKLLIVSSQSTIRCLQMSALHSRPSTPQTKTDRVIISLHSSNIYSDAVKLRTIRASSGCVMRAAADWGSSHSRWRCVSCHSPSPSNSVTAIG